MRSVKQPLTSETNMKQPNRSRTYHHVALVVCVLFVTGCSGSGESSPVESQPMSDTTLLEQESSAAGNESVDADNGGIVEGEIVPNDTEGSIEGESGETESTSENPTSVVPEPVAQTTTQVNFEITAPAYQSDSLQVQMTWGDINASAVWVGDELWSLSNDFPTETEALLSVTFYDRNGDVELARFSQEFRTNSNATENIIITADQFDSSLFDEDEDGVSNLDELVSGTDPSVIDGLQLEIRDVYSVSDFLTSRMSVSISFEGQLSDERPYFESFERLPVQGGYPGTISSVIDIDAAGNGTLTFSERLQGAISELNGTRANTGSAITWEGSNYNYDGQDNGHNVNFTNTVTVVNENTRSFVEEIVGSNGGTYSFRWNISSNLTGRLIEGTSFCEAIAGTISQTYSENYSSFPDVITTVTTVVKEIDDPYWRVESASSSNEISVYFARELVINRPVGSTPAVELAPENKYFICDFVDF